MIDLIPFIIKYDYEDMYGFGACVIFAKDMDDAVEQFKQHMYKSNNKEFFDRTSYHNKDFRWVSKNVFGWNTYFNDAANVCIKVREINMNYGTVIAIQEHFEEANL